MKIKFTGVPGEDLDTISMYGYDFPRGKFVEVQGAQAIGKLSRHPFFEAKDDPANAVEDAQIKREFTLAADQTLAPIEAEKAAEAETIANLTDEEKYGDDQATGDQDAGEAGRARGQRRRKSS